MRDFMLSNAPLTRPRRPAPKRQMRERRTAQALILFGIVLAVVELYVILGGL
ncbi:hypothetical protein SAMN05216228_1019112 [Rhizobium tibeticum]|uniref:Uncharacterized protein n=1 Tax=Rhizobium tibeticum TaxID=501024 RepID=A0A1H8QPA7_9HYPH|nr:hypothetical protein RTCCBAU85039_3897 [Rhizobium tibeticum]SEO55876.1 hypothetical protein SAMN05216228_1019112 [Rhizobium tibeticum]